MAPMNYVIGLYLVDRKYGGPEEGGWWYDAGELQTTLKAFPTSEKAHAYADRYNALLKRFVNRGRRRDLGSVCCEGAYQAHVHHIVVPLRFPATRPYYE